MPTFSQHGLTACLALFFVSCVTPGRVASHKREPITAPPEVLSQAADAHFPYVAALRAAEQRDAAALLKLIQFSTRTDAYGSIAHGVVLLELRDVFGTAAFNKVAAQATRQEQAAAQEEIDAAISVLNGPKWPNHAMQPTAGRSAASIPLMKTHPLQATLASASGG